MASRYSSQLGVRSHLELQRFKNSRIILALSAALILWTPLFAANGIVFERDASFFSTVQADTAWSLGAFSFKGGISNVQTQGLFYEPFAAVIWILSHLGLNIGAAGFSKVIPFAMTMVAAGGSYSLSKRFGAGPIGCCFAGFFYVFNPWSLDSFGYFYLWTGYCLLPVLVLGTLRIRGGEKTPIWFPFAILFLGGIIPWVVTAIVCVATAAMTRGENLRGFGRTLLRLGTNFVGAGAYWMFAYVLAILVPSKGFSLAYENHGSPLQSAHPLTDLLELRDFWWPHLNLSTYLGILPLAISALAVALLVISAMLYVALDLPVLFRHRDQSSRLILGTLMVIGIVLGAGTEGPTGWLYKAIRAWPLFGSSLIRSITRSPANLAFPFVAALGIALSLLMTPAKTISTLPPTRKQNLIKQLLISVGAFMILTIACVPSLISFWHVYEPIRVPASYSVLPTEIPRGTSLQIGYFPINAINTESGVWNYTWSTRLAADSTVLDAFLDAPTISPIDPAVSALDQLAVATWSNPAGVMKLERVARQLGVTSFVIEGDIQLPASQRAEMDRFVGSLRAKRLTEINLGTETVFRVPGPVRESIWGQGCAINTNFFSFGLVHVNCHSLQKGQPIVSIFSPFELPTPMVSTGFRVSDSKEIVDGIGTQMTINSNSSGWMIFLPNFLATVGGLATLIFLALARPIADAYMSRKVRPQNPNI